MRGAPPRLDNSRFLGEKKNRFSGSELHSLKSIKEKFFLCSIAPVVLLWSLAKNLSKMILLINCIISDRRIRNKMKCLASEFKSVQRGLKLKKRVLERQENIGACISVTCIVHTHLSYAIRIEYFVFEQPLVHSCCGRRCRCCWSIEIMWSFFLIFSIPIFSGTERYCITCCWWTRANISRKKEKSSPIERAAIEWTNSNC